MLPCGKLVCSSENIIILCNLVTKTNEIVFKGHSQTVRTLAVLQNGWLASGSYDNTIRLWDTGSGIEITRLEIDAPVLCLAALSDGSLVAGDQIGNLHWLQIVQ